MSSSRFVEFGSLMKKVNKKIKKKSSRPLPTIPMYIGIAAIFSGHRTSLFINLEISCFKYLTYNHINYKKPLLSEN